MSHITGSGMIPHPTKKGVGGPAKWLTKEAVAAKRKPDRAQPQGKRRCTNYGLAGGPDAKKNEEGVMSRVMLIAVMVLSAIVLVAQDNPYRQAQGWPQLPAGVKFGAVISADTDAKGNIWVFHRADPTILQFDPSG